MKIYVSDKEIDNNNLNYVEDDWREEYWLSRGQSYGRGFEICDCVGLVEIQSLESHEEEIRKPLEEEIERLKKENKQLIKDNKLLDKTKYTAQQDDINFFVSEERRKVIAELEEFENKHRLRARKISKEYPTDNEEQKARLYALSSGRFDILENLKQKLNEMKEV